MVARSIAAVARKSGDGTTYISEHEVTYPPSVSGSVDKTLNKQNTVIIGCFWKHALEIY